MAIRKQDSFKIILLLAACCLVSRIWGAGDEPRCRLEYEAAMTHFRAGVFDRAKNEFAAISDASDCPPVVRMCALNMVAQIDRIEGRNQEALKAFEALASYVEKDAANARQGGAAVELWYSAIIIGAEIYESLQDANSTIEQYSRTLNPPFKGRQKDSDQYHTLAKDRIRGLSPNAPDSEDDALILSYERAWRLDAAGKKEEAAKALVDVAATASTGPAICKIEIARTIQEYAKIQAAILFGEMGKYSQALLTLGRSSQTPGDAHIAELTKNVREGIETLRREENPLEE